MVPDCLAGFMGSGLPAILKPHSQLDRAVLMLEHVPRYLVPFHPKRIPHRFTDVLIIGGGLAGLRAALAVPPDQSVLVISKSSLRQSNSNYAQGGIAGVLDPRIGSRTISPIPCRPAAICATGPWSKWWFARRLAPSTN